MGETLLRKQLSDDSMWWLNRRIAEFREDGMTVFVKMDTREKKLLIQEQRELSRVISGLRKAIEANRQKLERP